MWSEPSLDVVVRCKDEMPYAARCFDALARQAPLGARLLVVDCRSTDGSREAAAARGAAVVDLDPRDYVPGAVLNMGMERTRSPFVAFVNADAVPLRDDALALLIAPLLADETLACTFGRQVARPSAAPETRADYERSFGPSASVALRRGAFFSMAASAVRRSAWESLPFDAQLRYSEDVDWSHRLAALGWRPRYVPEAIFEHSHDYDLRAQRRRRTGEGAADTAIHRLGARSLIGDFARPLAGSVLRDAREGRRSIAAIEGRVAQAAGYFEGRARRVEAPQGTRRRAPAARWSLSGDPALEARVTVELEQIGESARRALGGDLAALLLVGGYARGEGGAERRAGILAPHNDYDLLAVTPRVTPWIASAARELSATWTSRLGLHVDVTPVPLERLARPPRTLFWLDVTSGGARVLTGDASVLAKVPPLTPRAVPLEEAGRLLMNRAVGLALSRLEGAREDPVVLARHVHKAMLACGDALLLAADTYPADLPGRRAALARLEPTPDVGHDLVEAYDDAIAFRLDATSWRPRTGSVTDWWERSLPFLGRRHLRFESWRTGAPATPAGFVGFRGALFPELPDVRVRLPWLAALRARAAGAASLWPYVGHPRERLARVAVALAYGGAEERARAVALLGAPASASDAVITAKLRALSARGS